jgi:uncharacterized RDD family membrane protein YckC
MTTARARANGTGARVGEAEPAAVPAVPVARVGEAEPATVPAARVEEAEPATVIAARVGEIERADEPNGAGTRYAGLATRTVAFAVDAAVINVVAWVVAAIITLGLSLITVPDQVRTALIAIGAVVALFWTVGYFVFFWSATGQTPGNRVLGIRVEDAGGGPVKPRRALLRLLALPLSALPLCAGFLLILVDDRRRALHDRIARTTVSYVLPSRAAPRRARRAAGARGRG